ncbi:MAG: NADH-quinone oxidoreductase subunit D [Chitinophagia bacterium]|nr:NADH-quinone oxidoreductase subunit D [Chitinophagia bacterium]
MGPQHPATHGVLHLVVTLNGETIKKIEPHLGYIHRSIEKMCESLTYRQFIYVTSRMDYLSSHINNLGCALLVEKGMQIEVPDRAKYVRVILSELTRIASHELWLGAMAMDLGAFTPFFYAFREREMITDIMEDTCGARLTMNYIVPGGLMYDIHPDFQKKVKAFITQFKSKVTEYEDLVTNNVIFQSRTKGVGILSAEDAISYGKEMNQSIRIIEQLIDNIPEGDFVGKTKNVLKLPKGEFYTRVETARGEFGVYVVSEGGTTPHRIKFRSPGFSNLSVLNHISVGSKIGDLMASMGTLDLVIPDIDR